MNANKSQLMDKGNAASCLYQLGWVGIFVTVPSEYGRKESRSASLGMSW